MGLEFLGEVTWTVKLMAFFFSKLERIDVQSFLSPAHDKLSLE